MSLLEVKNLNQFFGKKQILKNVSFELSKKEVVVFLGPNGAGKTTLLRKTMGLLQTNTSKASEENIIIFNEKVINKWPVCRRVENGLLYLPQQTSLFRQINVINNLKIIFKYHKYWKDKNYTLFEEEMFFWLKQTNLISHIKQISGSLSGGQKRKLEVIRSILMHPKAIMFDEPFAGVDPKSIYELKKIFLEMATEGIAVLISDHNVDQLLSIATRVYVVIDGKIVTSGSIQDIMNNKETKNAYLGEQFYAEISSRFL